MEVKEKLLEQFELTAKLAGMKSKARELDNNINDLEKEINDQRRVKADLISSQEKAYQELEESGDTVSVIQNKIDALKKELTTAKSDQKKAQEVVDSFTDEVMSEPDKKVINLGKEKDKTHTEREALAKEINETQEKLHQLKEELKKDGLELNISGTPNQQTVIQL